MTAQSKITPHPLYALRAAFPEHHISKLPKESKAQADARRNNKQGINCKLCGGWHHPQAVHLDYVGHAALTDRLLDVDPEWSWEPMALTPEGLPAFDRNNGLWIKLTVLGVTRLGYGSADGKQGGDAIKEIIGDALRNAAMRFGAALDLWHKGDLHLEGNTEDAGGQSQGSANGAVSPQPTPQSITEADLSEIIQLCEAVGGNQAKAICDALAITDLRHIPARKAQAIINRLKDKQAEKVKAETNAQLATPFGDILHDEIPY